MKFLGVHFDCKLTWKHHVNSKITKTNFVLNKLKNFIPKATLKILYHTLIQPHLNYNIIAWGNATKTTLKRTVLLQKRAIRTMCLAKYNSHTDPLFKIKKILKVSDMYELEISHFMLKYEGNKLPDSFQKFYMTSENRARTRQATNYIIKPSKSKFTELMPSIAIPKYGTHGKMHSLKWKQVRNTQTHTVDNANQILFLQYLPKRFLNILINANISSISWWKNTYSSFLGQVYSTSVSKISSYTS